MTTSRRLRKAMTYEFCAVAKAAPAKSPLVTPTMRRALSDPALLGDVLAGDSWAAWRILLIAMMGEPLDDEERAVFKSLTGRENEPLVRVEEFWGDHPVAAERAALQPS